MAKAEEIKNSDLAGSWYPQSKTVLRNMLQGYLDSANPQKTDGQALAIISPHAGYQFSGPVAAYGFKALQGSPIETVIIIGFSHRIFFDGISVYAKGSWRTPLGDAKIDEDLAGKIVAENPRILFEASLFEGENSVEMQIPFVQVVFPDAKIVPIAFGTQKYEDAKSLADTLVQIIKDKKGVLIVASTDMSHYHSYDEAGSIDAHTIELLNKMDPKELYRRESTGACELCGMLPVASVLILAKSLGYDSIKILKYANSGDTFGDKSKVVGYVSAVIYKEKEASSALLNGIERKRLLSIARESITSFVRDKKRKSFAVKDPALNEAMGAFVTLHENGELRGCIGNMIGSGPLYKTVADMAIEAATGDPRFSPVLPDELDNIDIEISVLSPLKKVASYKDVKVPGHGVLVRRGFRSGVYLPQVAEETGWNREEFLTSLCAQKAGLPQDAWKDPATEIHVFSAEVFGEK